MTPQNFQNISHHDTRRARSVTRAFEATWDGDGGGDGDGDGDANRTGDGDGNKKSNCTWLRSQFADGVCLATILP